MPSPVYNEGVLMFCGWRSAKYTRPVPKWTVAILQRPDHWYRHGMLLLQIVGRRRRRRRSMTKSTVKIRRDLKVKVE